MLINGWRHNNQQHDACEFLSFLSGRHSFPMLQGDGQARKLVEGGFVDCMDRGHCAQPIALHFCAPPCGLRSNLRVSDMLNFWHCGQAGLTLGLTVPPAILLLQLCRFQVRDNHVFKIQMEVEIDTSLQVPCFVGPRTEVAPSTYVLRAYIVHHGSPPQAGHCTTFLRQDACGWHCDDGRKAKRCSSKFSRAQSCNCYLLLYSLQTEGSSDHA